MKSGVEITEQGIRNDEIQGEAVIKLKELFPELDSLTARESGVIARKMMEELLEKNVKIILDFEGIELITQGFGDEIVGVFVRKNGVDFIKQNIKLINAKDFIRGTLNWVISYSKKMAQSTSSS